MPTVLIADDEPVILRVLARFLEAPGRTVLTAANAADALELARAHAPIDVALLDKNLGDRSGLELARDLRGLDALTAVILITGYASLESAVEAVQIGAYDYVTKPVDDFDGLALKIANALEKVRLARAHEQVLARLAQSETRYRELFEAAPDALVVVDVARSCVCEVNASAAAMFDRARAELVGAEVGELFAVPLPPLDEWPEGGLQLTCSKRGGATFPAEVTIGDGRLDGCATRILTVRDVSVRERLLAERRAVEEELRQAQKMDAVGRLAGGLAHDLGNVLAVVLSCVEQLHSRDDAALREELDIMHVAVERGSDLVKQMMRLTRKGPSNPALIPVAAAIEETTKLLRRSLGDRVALVTEAAPDAWSIRMDPTHLGQVLLNLAVNARDAMSEGGTLRIRVENCPGEAPREGAPGAPADRVVISVADTGVGMTPEVRERIFEPFFTTKDSGKGTGLGLAVTYGIVRQAGGTISVESEPGRGSTFRISLPRARENAPPASVQPPAPPARATGRTVLLVEDATPLRAAMAQTLNGLGLRVVDAGSAEDALRAIDHHRCAIDLLVTDLILPGMPGTELARALRRVHPTCPVLLVTSAPGDARADEFAQRGGRVLVKPFHQAALIEEATRLVAVSSPAGI
jgi:two-component system, cell cycle sensor histidine kinase and response regulator CckA